MLTKQAQDALQKRVDTGHKCIEAAWGRDPDTVEDLETAANDAISDILTAVFGPAGKLVETLVPGAFRPNSKVELDDNACDNARALVLAAFDSYLGDAEDYVEEAEEAEEEPAPEPPITDLVVLHLGDSGWLIVTS